MKQNHKIENMSDDPTIRELQATIHHLETRLSTYEGTADALCSSRQKYAALIETLPHGVEECTVEGIITFSNRAYHRMCGYADGELIGKSIWDLTADPDERVALPGVLMHLAATRPPPRPYMTQKLARDGRRIDVQVDWNYAFDGQGQVVGFIAVITDISHRLAATRALEESEQRYRALFEKAGDAIFLLEAEGPDHGRIIDANQAAADMHGYTVDTTKKLNIRDLDTPQDARKVCDRVERMLGGEWIHERISHRRSDGSEFPVEISAGMISIGDKKAILAFDRDISERKAAEDRLKESEERYRAVFEGSGEGILLADIETLQFRFANPAICSFLGYSRQELLGMTVPLIHPEKDREWILGEFRSQALGAKVLAEQIPCLHKDRHVVFADIRTSRIELSGQVLIVGFFADVTAQVGIKKALNEQVLFLQTLVDTLPHPIFFKDNQGRYLGCNLAFEAFIGMKKEDLVGKTVYDIASKELAEVYEAADRALLESRQPQTYEASVRYADGSLHNVIFNKAVFYHQDGSLAGLVGAMLDITDRKRADEEKALRDRQLRQAQKMEAIGTLAGGIAHDFNNILSAIVGYTDITLHDLPADAPVAGYLKKVLQAGNRARDLVNQILAFSRATEQETRPVVVKHIAKEAMKLLQATLPSTIRIQSNIRSGAAIMADPTQIHQVIMNLCTNAAHAMQAQGGRLTVSLTKATSGEQDQGRPSELGPGAYLILAIGDTGTGIEPDMLERIFDPFFTTKKPGEGTGMGLAVVHGIIQDCGGSIQVHSVPGEGTSFQVWLPVIEVEDRTPPPVKTPLPLGHESILFVDDEPDLVDVGLQMLTMLGYRVTAINDSREALDRFQRSPHEFDLVITDMTMPRMTGDLLSQHLLAIRPDIPIIVCTGYSEKVDAESIRSMGLAGLAYKPLITRDLAELIRRALDQR
jgi:PAS domain S-box-containing protein